MKPILSPYLNFNGNCAEAMKFYQSVLGGKLKLQTFAESGMPTPKEYKNKTVHAYLKNDALSFMASDGAPGSTVTMGDNVHMSINGDDRDTLTKIFRRLSDGGTVTMPLAKQFWGDTFGMLTDRFGVHWMVNIASGKQP